MKIAEMLEEIDLDEMERQAYEDIRSGKVTKRQKGVKVLRAVKGLKRAGAQPKDLLIDRVPVIPPQFRPYTMAGQTFVPGDANELYADLINARKIQDQADQVLGDDPDANRYVRHAVRAAFGYEDSPNPKIRNRKVSGLMQKVLGSGPKTSFVQSKLVSKPQDMVGRAVISPGADLGMDEIEIPEAMAWEIYSPRIRRGLVARGIPPSRALKLEKDRDPAARQVLDQLLKTYPVMSSRSPAWHHFSYLSFWPKITEGDNVLVNPYVTAGLGADFDGDDQHNYVVFSISKEQKSNLQLHFVDLNPLLSENPEMFTRLNIPTLDLANNAVGLLDLQDFPHGEMLGEKKTSISHTKFFRSLAGLRVIAYNESDNAPVWADVAGWSEHVGPPVEIVSLENRKQIFTDNDPRAVFGVDPAGALELKRFSPSEALEKGVVVPMIRDTDKVLQQLGGTTSVRVSDDTTCTFNELFLDFEFGWFLGAMCGDGWWDKRDHDFYERKGFSGRRNINLADLLGQNAERAEQFINKNLKAGDTLHVYSLKQSKLEGDSRYGDTVKYSFNFKHSELLAEFLSEHIGGARDSLTAGSGNKRVPSFIFSAPQEFRRGFLTGMVDTDGCCSVSMAKGKAQLMCAISSTSLRLIRELQLVCRSLDVQSSVTFSKITSGGGKSWVLSMSSPDCKRLDLFRDLACDAKRNNFINTPVTLNNASLVYDKVVFPRRVAELLLADLPAPRPSGGAKARQLTNVWNVVHQARKLGAISRVGVERAMSVLLQVEVRRAFVRDKALAMLRSSEALFPFEKEHSNLIREAIRAVAPFGHPLYRKGCGVAARVNQPLKAGRLGPKAARGICEWLEENAVATTARTLPEIADWVEKYVNSSVSWSPVVRVEKTGNSETGYDLTVPGYETFMSADGVILSNTMSVHVPYTDEALKDAKEKLLPSKLLFSIRSRDKTLAVPKHEQILGLASSQLNPSGVVHQFASRDEAMKALSEGTVKLQDQIEIPDEPEKTYGNEELDGSASGPRPTTMG